MSKFQSGDQVRVIEGLNKGSKGTVVSEIKSAIYPRPTFRVLLDDYREVILFAYSLEHVNPPRAVLSDTDRQLVLDLLRDKLAQVTKEQEDLDRLISALSEGQL